MSSAMPEPGDLIEIFRGLYQHWAVYIGGGFVVHLTSTTVSANTSGVMSSTSGIAVVKKEKLLDVVGTDKWRVNNSLDNKYIPRSAMTIVQEALRRVGDVVRYSVFSKNCEHFATDLHYGKPESRQAQQAKSTIGVIAAVGLGIGALVAVSRGNNKEKKNTQ